MSYPTFAYRPLTRTSYRVVDAQTGEEYGTVRQPLGAGTGWLGSLGLVQLGVPFLTRTEAAQAVYRARYAHGFEAGVL